MKNKYIILIFIIIATPLWGAKPIITVPELSQTLEIELYEESEGLFALKLLEYYKMAVILETQLKILGVESQNKALQPVFEEFEDMELKILKKYHKIAKSLEKDVIDAPESDRQILLENINELEAKLRDTIAINTIEKGAIRNELLDIMLSRLQECESLNAQNIDLVMAQNFVDCMDYRTWFSITGISKVFISDGNDVMKNDPGLGVQLAVNAGKLVGFWDGFELKYEYFAPKFFSEYRYEDNIIPFSREQWNTNVNSVSAGGKAVLGKSPELIHGFNIFLGYFWANGNIYNRSDGYMNWDGASFSLDYFLAAPSCKYPIEINFGFTVYNSFSRNLVFQTSKPNYELNDLGKTHLSINLGLRYNIWRSPF